MEHVMKRRPMPTEQQGSSTPLPFEPTPTPAEHEASKVVSLEVVQGGLTLHRTTQRVTLKKTYPSKGSRAARWVVLRWKRLLHEGVKLDLFYADRPTGRKVFTHFENALAYYESFDSNVIRPVEPFATKV